MGYAASSFQYGASVWANGIRQHFLRFGGKHQSTKGTDPILLLPGITSPAATWAFVGERLGRRFDTYVVDIRGRGLSASGTGLDYSLDAMSSDVVALAKTLGLSRYSILGHSMGGRIAIRIAAQRPTGLQRLVIVDPPVSGPGRRPYPAPLDWYVDSIALSKQGMTADQMRVFCPAWPEHHLRVRAEWLATCSEEAVLHCFKAFGTDDIHADMPQIACPTLFILAQSGDVVTDSEMTEIKSLIPHVLSVRVPDCGHMIPYENEEGFFLGLGDFLGSSIYACE